MRRNGNKRWDVCGHVQVTEEMNSESRVLHVSTTVVSCSCTHNPFAEELTLLAHSWVLWSACFVHCLRWKKRDAHHNGKSIVSPYLKPEPTSCLAFPLSSLPLRTPYQRCSQSRKSRCCAACGTHPRWGCHCACTSQSCGRRTGHRHGMRLPGAPACQAFLSVAQAYVLNPFTSPALSSPLHTPVPQLSIVPNLDCRLFFLTISMNTASASGLRPAVGLRTSKADNENHVRTDAVESLYTPEAPPHAQMLPRQTKRTLILSTASLAGEAIVALYGLCT